MPSSYSTSLKLELIANGEQATLWGTTTNNNLGGLLEEAIAGVHTLTLSGASTTLTTTNGLIGSGALDHARNSTLVFAGNPGGAATVIVPSVEKTYLIRNTTAYTVTVKTAAGAGVDVLAGSALPVFCDASSVYPGWERGLGTAALPSYTFGTDYNTGFYSPTADQIGISVGGSVKVAVTGTTVDVTAAKVNTAASTTGLAGLSIPHGTAPTSPVNGDVWMTSAGGLFARVNGATQNYVYQDTTNSFSINSGRVNTYAASNPMFEVHKSGIKAYGFYVDSNNSGSIVETNGSGTAGTMRMQLTSAGGAWFGVGYPADLATGNMGVVRTSAGDTTFRWYQQGVTEWWMGTASGNSTLLIGTGSGVASPFLFAAQSGSVTFAPYTDNIAACGLATNRWTTIYATSGTVNSSDASLKTNVQSCAYGLNFINQLSPVSYHWIAGPDQKTKHYGFIAQEVEQLVRNGDGFVDAPDAGPKGLRYTELIAPIVKAIQELSAEVERLKKKCGD